MKDTPFDPYYRWLGIPASEQPVDHYRLLGIVRFESNREIIDNASQRQISFVRTFALGEHAEHSQTLLNELAAARSILLNPASKETYDESLREQKKYSEPELAPSPNFPDAEVLSSQSSTVDIDPPSVVHAKLQRQENQDPSKPNLSVLLGSFILIISAGLLWGLIRVGQSTIKFISGPPPLAVAPFDAEQAKAYQEAWAAKNRVPIAFSNSVGMNLTLIPPGSFRNQSGEKVAIDELYYIGTYEVTQGQYRELMGMTTATDGSSIHPVDSVSYEQIEDFCHRLSSLPAEKAAGRIYRLPHESEWEHACRAGTTSTFFFTEENVANLTDLKQYAVCGKRNDNTEEIGKKRPNPWGLFDVYGNVWEVCIDPIDPSSPLGSRVGKGGSSYHNTDACNSTFRVNSSPEGHSHQGFRVVCMLAR